MRGNVVAVVPAYEPPLELVDLVAALCTQVAQVLVVDDGSLTATATEVFESCTVHGARVLKHGDNRGVAAALNTGVRAALEDGGADAVFTVDQDSRVPIAFVERLRVAQASAEAAGVAVGLVAPERVEGLPSQARRRREDGIVLGRDPIQSGLLLPAQTWRTVGPFDESLFIDGVDTDYSMRCLDAGLAVVVASGLELGHRLGSTHEVTVAGRTISLTHSAPYRYYYLTRNRLRLVRRHARRHPAWAATQVAGLGRHLGIVITLLPDREARVREVWRGLRDGLRGTTGPRATH